MNVSKLPESQALNAGADLWVIKNDPGLFWWGKLDFYSHFLLSQVQLKPETFTPQALQKIIQETSFSTQSSVHIENHILLGSEAHFLNKWILVWSGSEVELADVICDMVANLKVGSVRLFSHSKPVLTPLEARPTARSLNITYIENT
jgi:hypothetical protein